TIRRLCRQTSPWTYRKTTKVCPGDLTIGYQSVYVSWHRILHHADRSRLLVLSRSYPCRHWMPVRRKRLGYLLHPPNRPKCDPFVFLLCRWSSRNPAYPDYIAPGFLSVRPELPVQRPTGRGRVSSETKPLLIILIFEYS